MDRHHEIIILIVVAEAVIAFGVPLMCWFAQIELEGVSTATLIIDWVKFVVLMAIGTVVAWFTVMGFGTKVEKTTGIRHF